MTYLRWHPFFETVVWSSLFHEANYFFSAKYEEGNNNEEKGNDYK
jgi:hypothetical protein